MDRFNALDNLFTQEQHNLYLITEYPFRIKILRDALDKKLKEDPEYEVFVPLSYWKLERRMTNKAETALIEPYKWFISNKGRLLSTRNKDPLIISMGVNSTGYIQSIESTKGKSHSITIHRAIGCVFIPLTEDLGGSHPKELEVNHIDGDKGNFDLGNLEWLTKSGNHIHSIETGLRTFITTPLKGRVIKGNFIGYEFLLVGPSEMTKYGFDQGAVSNTLNGNLKSHLNCLFFTATEKEIKTLPKGPSSEVLVDLKATNPLAKFKTVGTELLTGKTISAIGEKEIKLLGFSPGAIANVIAGKAKTSSGYTWKRIPL